MWTAALAASTSDAVAQWLAKHKPDSVDILKDDKYGLFRGVGPAKDVRSISWTRRGWRDTAMEVLFTSWLFHTDALASPPPFDWKALESEFTLAPLPLVG